MHCCESRFLTLEPFGTAMQRLSSSAFRPRWRRATIKTQGERPSPRVNATLMGEDDASWHERRWMSMGSRRPRRPRTAIFFPGTKLPLFKQLPQRLIRLYMEKGAHTRQGLTEGITGQGTQKVGMLTPWLEAFPSTARELIQEVDHYAGFKLSDVIQNGPSKVLTQTTNAQPAIMATSIVILKILEREFSFKVADNFDITLGHSLGEFAALVAGGYITFQDSLYLVKRRAAAMSDATKKAIQEYGGEYGMVAIITEPEYLRGLIAAIHDFVGHSSAGSKGESSEHVPPIEQVLIANINSRNQIVLSGNIERITTLMAHVRQFLGHDPRAVRLHSDSPFHSPIMKPAVAVMQSLLGHKSRVPGREGEDIITFPGDIPCISNVTARPFRSKEQLKELLARGCLETVRWWDSIRYLDQQEKVRRWVGIGPGKVGRNLVGKEVGMRGKDSVKGGGVWAITDPSEIEEVLRGLEETAGVADE
ncbi:[acyl-carrier-protein] S-malonyltransferase [Metarhizium acridum]|uniref:[acyl-carrier-protein] S-malonyltransferase n=1 Tax=Metarhizium acridum TaxID=92637 RepID=UPI001C6B4E22|nr:[acyl-carrier-protein] S-malonyltransferase [Metarhizium acridum]